MPYLRKDMQFDHYRWMEDDSGTVFTGEPSRRLFDPYNGNQVLFLINCYMSVSGRSSDIEARMAENRIAYKLPLSSKSERSVLNWLMEDITV